MKQKIRVLLSDTFDPWFNLATEELIFHDMDPFCKTLFLWRNDNTIVIGRFQNPWQECNTKKMEADGIKLARRQSGGGAVYHDLGNSNFTFLSSKQNFDKSIHNTIITTAINSFGIHSFASGRNDILVATATGDKKISGSAFKEGKDRCFHHGTLLISSDLSKLATYLSPDPKKLHSKGVTSVRQRVCNLSELNATITHEELCKRIIEQFFLYHQEECPLELLNHEVLKQNPILKERYEKMSDWNWRFGHSPPFTHTLCERFAWGNMNLHFNVEKATISEIKIYSDTLYPEMIELLTTHLKHQSYTPAAIKLALQKVKSMLPTLTEQIDEFENFLLHAIE
ncbi:MAG: lipoate--protein ligase [Oligoflexia bacterium]|nr:lipoate--protein ligase [Oligoflexia bacterium]